MLEVISFCSDYPVTTERFFFFFFTNMEHKQKMMLSLIINLSKNAKL